MPRRVRKTRRLRRRAFLAVLLLLLGGASVGAGWAFASTRPKSAPSSRKLEHSLAQGDFPLAGKILPDPLSSPEIHQIEEQCNLQGAYPGGDEFDLDNSDWGYSSQEGLLPKPKTDLDLKAYGWDGKTPGWARLTREDAERYLPAGLSLREAVQEVEVCLWPERQQAQIRLRLDDRLELPEAPSLAEVWSQIPAAPSLGCLRREILARVFASEAGVLQRLGATSQHWVALASEAELEPGCWRRLQAGCLPMALWTDHPARGIGAGREWQVVESSQGTLWNLGMPGSPGLSSPPRKQGLGAGHLQQGQLRWDWELEQVGQSLLVQLRWRENPSDQTEIPELGPDQECIYPPKPNVIAGQ